MSDGLTLIYRKRMGIGFFESIDKKFHTRVTPHSFITRLIDGRVGCVDSRPMTTPTAATAAAISRPNQHRYSGGMATQMAAIDMADQTICMPPLLSGPKLLNKFAKQMCRNRKLRSVMVPLHLNLNPGMKDDDDDDDDDDDAGVRGVIPSIEVPPPTTATVSATAATPTVATSCGGDDNGTLDFYDDVPTPTATTITSLPRL